MSIVRGWIELPDEVRTLGSATAYIRVEDVSRADAAAVRLGHQVLDNLRQGDLARGRLAFQVSVSEPAEGAVCTVRVHLDLDGDGAISRGDYVSTEHVPVLVGDASTPVSVRLRRVG